MLPCSKPGELYAVDAKSVNAGVPYADSFYVTTHYCISRASESKSCLAVYAQVKFKKSLWVFVKSKYESKYNVNSNSMGREHFAVLLSSDKLIGSFHYTALWSIFQLTWDVCVKRNLEWNTRFVWKVMRLIGEHLFNWRYVYTHVIFFKITFLSMNTPLPPVLPRVVARLEVSFRPSVTTARTFLTVLKWRHLKRNLSWGKKKKSGVARSEL